MSLGSTTSEDVTMPGCCIGGAAHCGVTPAPSCTGPGWSWAPSLADGECVVLQPRSAVGADDSFRFSAAVRSRTLAPVTLVVGVGSWRCPRVPSLGRPTPAGTPAANASSGGWRQ